MDYKFEPSSYVISYKPLGGGLVFTSYVEDPECLRMEIDLLLEHCEEVSVKKTKLKHDWKEIF